jgi:hypothetical protein
MYGLCIIAISLMIIGLDRYDITRIVGRHTKQGLLGLERNWNNDDRRGGMKAQPSSRIITDENLDIHFHYILYLDSMIPSTGAIEEYLSNWINSIEINDSPISTLYIITRHPWIARKFREFPSSSFLASHDRSNRAKDQKIVSSSTDSRVIKVIQLPGFESNTKMMMNQKEHREFESIGELQAGNHDWFIVHENLVRFPKDFQNYLSSM